MNKILGSGIVGSAFMFGLAQESFWGAVAGLTMAGLAGMIGWRFGKKR